MQIKTASFLALSATLAIAAQGYIWSHDTSWGDEGNKVMTSLSNYATRQKDDAVSSVKSSVRNVYDSGLRSVGIEKNDKAEKPSTVATNRAPEVSQPRLAEIEVLKEEVTQNLIDSLKISGPKSSTETTYMSKEEVVGIIKKYSDDSGKKIMIVSDEDAKNNVFGSTKEKEILSVSDTVKIIRASRPDAGSILVVDKLPENSVSRPKNKF